MKREEFLISFREALTGVVPERVIQENMMYYQNYIENQMREGRIEDDILKELGNPRLLAKTIIESSKFAMREETQDRFYTSSDDEEQYSRENSSQHSKYEKKDRKPRMHTWNIPGWIAGILGILFMALVICFVFSVISFFAPVIVVAVISILVYKIIRWLSVRY